MSFTLFFFKENKINLLLNRNGLHFIRLLISFSFFWYLNNVDYSLNHITKKNLNDTFNFKSINQSRLVLLSLNDFICGLWHFLYGLIKLKTI